MADTTFIDRQTPIISDWLNDVNDFVYANNVVNLDGKPYSDLVVGDDYTDALSAAVATGKNVYVPWRSTTRTVTAGVALANHQVVFGDSPGGARFKFMPASGLGVLFNADGKTGAGIRGLWIEGSGTLSAAPGIASSYTLSGFRGLSSAVDCFVDRCTFSNWEGGAIFFQDATGCSATNNKFHTAKTQPVVTDNFGAADITFWGSSVDCRAEGNYSDSGAAFGVVLQTVSGAAQTAKRNKIRGNQITGALNYGILVYNQSNGTPPVTNNIYDTEISGNTIKDVYGYYTNPASGLKDYGAGIYVLSSERTVIANNIVENVCINTAGSTLTPAGISYNAASTVTIIGNKIKTSAWYGIFVTDGLQLGEGANAGSANFVPSGFTIISSNTVEDTVKHGIYIKDKHKVKCYGNTVNGVTGASQSGIVTEVAVANYPTMKWISITGNSCYGFVTAGILSGLTQGADISGNQIDGSAGGTTGIFAESTDGTINCNNVRSVAGIGLSFRSTGANSTASGNLVTGCTTGVTAAHRVKWGENEIRGNTTDWTTPALGGSYAYLQASTPVRGSAWLVNDRVRQLTSAAGSPKAWVCTVASATTTGSITSGTNTLTLAAASTFANGQGITVAGAGAAGAALNTTISSGGGTVNLVLVANASTTVSGATTTHAGTWVSEGNL